MEVQLFTIHSKSGLLPALFQEAGKSGHPLTAKEKNGKNVLEKIAKLPLNNLVFLYLDIVNQGAAEKRSQMMQALQLNTKNFFSLYRAFYGRHCEIFGAAFKKKA